MPIYEYRCTACNHTLEIIQKLADPQPKECPNCHGLTLNKLVSAASFRLKGSGWYETDFKDKRKKNIQDDAAEPVDTTTQSKPDKTVETKSAATPASTTPTPATTTTTTSAT